MWQLIHDTAWSLHYGKMRELFFHDGITLATWVLVVVTFLLVLMPVALDRLNRKNEPNSSGIVKGREIEAEPKYQFGLKRIVRPAKRIPLVDYVREPAIELWFANLSSSALYVDKLFVKHRDFNQGVIQVNETARSGEQISFEIPDSFWQEVPGIKGSSTGNYLYGDHEVWLELVDARGNFLTQRILHQFLFMQRLFYEIKRGGLEDRQPHCPKCGAQMNAVLPGTGLLTEEEVQRESWQPMLRELSESCPDHSSSSLKSLGSTTPPWIPELPQEQTNA